MIVRSALFLLLTIPAHAAEVEVCFTPGDDCAGRIVAAIEASESEILVQAYSFTSPAIGKALVDAHKRGIAVRVILDKSQRTERYSGATFLANAGIPVLIDSAHAIAHNKVMVLDGKRVITGSFNFTKSAQERNAENVAIVDDEGIALRYARNWRAHVGHSERYR